MADVYFLVDADNSIVGSVVWDGNPGWQPPHWLRAVKANDGHWCEGWKWDGSRAVDPNPPPPEQPRKEVPSTPSQPGMDVV